MKIISITYHAIRIETVVDAMSSGENMSGTNNGTTANVLFIRLKGDLVVKLADCSYVTTNKSLGLIAISLYTRIII